MNKIDSRGIGSTGYAPTSSNNYPTAIYPGLMAKSTHISISVYHIKNTTITTTTTTDDTYNIVKTIPHPLRRQIHLARLLRRSVLRALHPRSRSARLLATLIQGLDPRSFHTARGHACRLRCGILLLLLLLLSRSGVEALR